MWVLTHTAHSPTNKKLTYIYFQKQYVSEEHTHLNCCRLLSLWALYVKLAIYALGLYFHLILGECYILIKLLLPNCGFVQSSYCKVIFYICLLLSCCDHFYPQRCYGLTGFADFMVFLHVCLWCPCPCPLSSPLWGQCCCPQAWNILLHSLPVIYHPVNFTQASSELGTQLRPWSWYDSQELWMT